VCVCVSVGQITANIMKLSEQIGSGSVDHGSGSVDR